MNYSVHNHANMQKIGCSIGVLYYGDLSSLKSQFQSVESVYFLLLTGRVPLAAYWIRVILFDASTRQLCPRMQS